MKAKAVRRLTLGAPLVALALTLPAGQAQAHPFGEPQSVDITSLDDGVRVAWKASPDDVTMLAIDLDLIDEMRTFVFQDGALVPEESEETDGVVLAASADFGDYLREHVLVVGDGAPCAGDLQPVRDVSTEGATVDFDCGGPVTEAVVTITTLTDLHPSYRTLATSVGGQRRAYTSKQDTFTWAFPAPGVAPSGDADGGGGRGASAAWQLGGVGLAAGALGGGGWWLRRRRTAGSGA